MLWKSSHLNFWEAVPSHVLYHPTVHTRTCSFCPHLTLEPVGHPRHLLLSAHQSAVTVTLSSMWVVNGTPLSLSLCACLIELNTMISWSTYTAENDRISLNVPSGVYARYVCPFPHSSAGRDSGCSHFFDCCDEGRSMLGCRSFIK